MARCDVLFVATPFLPEHQPSLGISSLAAVLERAGYNAQTRYLNIEYAKAEGFGPSAHIGGSFPVSVLLGEMVFAPALWGEGRVDWVGYEARLREMLTATFYNSVHTSEIISAARSLASRSMQTIERWAESIVADAPRILGLTSTFQQHVASLALAQAVRRRRSRQELAIVIGGANCEGEMGKFAADTFPFLDHIVSGEGEGLVVELVSEILASQREGRPADYPRYVVGPIVSDLNALPIPEFGSYVAAIAGTEMAERFNLCAESSRGCWWGMKSHCTFCGLNGGTMGYRSKAPERMLEEFSELRRKYDRSSFMMADNIIDMDYLRTALPTLAGAETKLELFYETKANLRKEQLTMMAAAGIRRLQPGIESLNTAVLKLMAKGTSCLQNLQLLKWSQELGIGLAWNILTGFPGEPKAAYEAMTAMIPALTHLPPPTGSGHLRLDRFSPFWHSPAKHGIRNVRHSWAYNYAYPGISTELRSKIAYFFEFDYEDGRDPNTYCKPLLAALDDWRNAHRAGAQLHFLQIGDDLAVRDTRPGFAGHEGERIITLSATEARVLKRLDAAASAEKLGDIAPDQMIRTSLLERLVNRGLLMRDGDLYMSLVTDYDACDAVADLRFRLRSEQLGMAWLSLT